MEKITRAEEIAQLFESCRQGGLLDPELLEIGRKRLSSGARVRWRDENIGGRLRAGLEEYGENSVWHLMLDPKIINELLLYRVDTIGSTRVLVEIFNATKRVQLRTISRKRIAEIREKLVEFDELRAQSAKDSL